MSQMRKDIPSILTEVADLVEELMPQVLELRFEVEWKLDGSPVTPADKLLEERIGRLLRQRLEGVQIIGEETFKQGVPITSSWLAVLDPIDGTENFCSGLKLWGVALSIWYNGRHEGSMLLMPEMKEKLLSGDVFKIPNSRIAGFSSSFHPDIASGLAENKEGRIMGCAVYNLINVIRGSFSRFINPKGAYSWDLLAGVVLAYEAGCYVLVEGTEYAGQFLEPNQRYRVDIQHRYDHHSR